MAGVLSRLAAAAAVLVLSGQAAHAAFVTEYFNGYGTGVTDLVGLNGGAGWTGAWAGDTLPDFGPLANNAAYNLTYSAPGYSNAGNGSSLSDGAAIMGGGTAGNTATRALRVGGTTPDTGLTGTVWVSTLVNAGTLSSSHMLLWIDRPDVSNSFVSIRGLSAPTGLQSQLRYNAATVTGPTNAYAISTTYLILAKVGINTSGTTDALDMWIDPDLTGGEAGLGTPTLSGANNADAYGNAFSGVGVSFQGYGKLDAIRISNGPTAFYDVTLVPEPAAAGALAAGLLGCLSLRRRRRT